MIFLLLLIIIVMFPATYLLRKGHKIYWFAGILLGWCLCTAGFLLFYAKTAGFSYYTNRLLFVFDSIRTWLLYVPISLSRVTMMQVVGRSVFTVCLFGFSCIMADGIPHPARRAGNLANLLLGAANIVFYSPAVYQWASAELPLGSLRLIAFGVRAWFAVVALVSFINLWARYKNTTFKWFKSKQAYLNTGLLAFTGFYIYVIFRGPIQYSDSKSYFHLYGNFSYYNPPITPWEWGLWLILLVAMLATSIYSFWQYSRYEKQFQNDDVRLKNKMVFMQGGISILSHAVKNQMITSGLMLSDAAEKLQGGEENRAAQKLIFQVIEQNQAMLSRLDSLRRALKQREMNLQSVKCQQFLKQLSEQVSVPENIEFTIQAQDPKLSLLVDASCLAEALANVIVNAFEAIDTASGTVSVSQYVEDGWCVIQIQDNGPGMDSSCLAQIFDPFYSNKNSSHNWGIGLSYTKQVVAAHGGIIEAKSVPHRGTSFFILLPYQ